MKECTKKLANLSYTVLRCFSYCFLCDPRVDLRPSWDFLIPVCTEKKNVAFLLKSLLFEGYATVQTCIFRAWDTCDSTVFPSRMGNWHII